MKINEIIKQKRKEKHFTQEQVAQRLGVSTPAVNKWENNISYPDITILPALARLLDTDLNTLLSFQDDLSDIEISMFLNECSDIFQNQGIDIVFQKIKEKINEFPNCDQLILSSAVLLEGFICHRKVVHKEQYQLYVEDLYERVLESQDVNIRTQAQSSLVMRYIRQKEYEKAETLLLEVPEKQSVDKKKFKACLYKEYEQFDQAKQLEQERLISNVQQIQDILFSLLDIALKTKNYEEAEYIANVSQQSAKIFDLWEYSSYVAHFMLYTNRKQKIKSLSTLQSMLKSIKKPWDIHASPLYSQIKTKEVDSNFSDLLKKEILEEISQDKELEFLKDGHILDK